ncbi:MAG: histidine--tRNA ligase [Patescibacteria group bacterium]|nr:histidine--tRNA ligase [Patescibacteria group bacterium]
MITPQTLKGFRDFLPYEARKRNDVIKIIQSIFETFGFDPLETPALEYASTLLGKYGEETEKLLYLFEDNGGRQVGLRYDQTVPLARVISQYNDALPRPFKRYQIQPVWRAENTQKGRFREFLQCDIDTIGISSLVADAEIIICVLQVAHALKLPSPTVMINDRTVFDSLKLSKTEIIILDKLDKIGKDAVIELLNKEGLDGKEIFDRIQTSEKTERLCKIFTLLSDAGYTEQKDFQFDPFLARGLDYYTSTIFELKDSSYPAGSLAGGGRYDTLISRFLGKDIPAVGVAFGFDRIMDALEHLGRLQTTPTATRVLVTIFSPAMLKDSFMIAQTLRRYHIGTEIYLDPEAKLEKQLKYADKKHIPYAIIQGTEEKDRRIIQLKDMKKQTQHQMTLEDCIKFLTAHEHTKG